MLTSLSLDREKKKKEEKRRLPLVLRRFRSGGFQLDLSRFGRLRFRQNELQYAVFKCRCDPVAVDVLGQCENPLVIAVGIFVVDPLVSGMLVGGATSADRQYAAFQTDIDAVGRDPGHLREHDNAVFRFINVCGWHKYRTWRHAFVGLSRRGGLLLNSVGCLGHDGLLPLLASLPCADFDFLWPICFEPLQLDLENAVVEARLNLVRIDAKRQLNGARERAIGALAPLPADIRLVRLRFALAG